MTNYPKYLILILAVALVAVMFAGCTSTPAPAQTTTTVPVQKATTAPAQIMTTGASFPVVFAEEFEDGITPLLIKMTEDLSNSDYASLQRDSDKFSSQARSSYDRISASEASPEWQPAKTSTLNLLLNFEKAGGLYSKAASAYQSGDKSNAVLYLEQGNTYMQNAVDGMTNTLALFPK